MQIKRIKGVIKKEEYTTPHDIVLPSFFTASKKRFGQAEE
jgi:hypothetical protein